MSDSPHFEYYAPDLPSFVRSASFHAARSHQRLPCPLDLSSSESSSSSSDSEEAGYLSASCSSSPVSPRLRPKTAHRMNGDALPTAQDLIVPANLPIKTQNSPCFVHSHLASANEKLPAPEATHVKSPLSDNVHDTLAHLVLNEDNKTPRTATGIRKLGPTPLSASRTEDEEDDEDGSMTEEGESDEASSLTRKLAETAVSVREMSKQLGRARVKSNINSILIITKARDNHLIKLTRELAIWIMTSMRSARERGVTVYVDHQLKKSKRFDAAGIQRDYPQLFKPFFRRFSRRNSSTSLSSDLSELKRHGSLKGLTSKTVPPTPARQNSDFVSNGLGPTEEEYQGQLRYWTAEMCTKSPHLFDFVITLGGDGTVLFASWLFQRIVPPIIPFALGSLGFLTNFDFSNYKNVLNSVVQEGVRVNLRMRFTCTVYRAVESDSKRKAMRSGKTGEIYMTDLQSGDWDAIESGGGPRAPGKEGEKDREVLCFSTRPVEEFEVINDLVVDRGPSPYVSLLELFGDEHHMTTVQADGLCIATPTGSTAYSLSAGGSLVHPESPAILVTPICPHTLSFRPILLPDSMELRICVPYNSRSTAWASFDGRGRVELKQGDHIKVTASSFPFPTVCADKQSTDWFHSIARTLKWNERQRQKSFVVVEEDRQAAGPNASKAHAAKGKKEPHSPSEYAVAAPEGSPSLSKEEDDDGQYDIDDLSGAETSNPPSPPPSLAHETRHATRQSTASSNGDSLTDSDSRFVDPLPHPPKLSQRHSQTKESFGYRPRTTSTDPPPPIREGEMGDRDHLLDRTPLDSKRRPKQLRLPSHQQKTEVRPRKKSDARSPLDLPAGAGDRLERRRTNDGGPRRAFAIYGDDESDASVSDLSES